MNPSLKYKLEPGSFTSLLRAYQDSKPLTCDEVNQLWRNENLLSSAKLDPVLHYYLKHLHKKPAKKLTMHLPANQMTKLSFQELKKAIFELLQDNLSHVDLDMTFEQYLKFRVLGLDELIFYHRFEFFTRSPLLAGSLPELLYFQWGKVFAVARFDFSHPENNLKGEVHLYLEEMHDRHLYQCIKEYTEQHKEELHLQHLMTQRYAPEETLKEQPIYHTPRPKFSCFHHNKEEDE